MGRRGSTETITSLLLAFLEQRTWRQAALASRLGVQRKTLVRILGDLQDARMPLERQEELPQVYWSVPKNWFPGAVAFLQKDVPDLVKVLQRAPKSKVRDRLLEHVSGAIGYAPRADVPDPGGRIVTRQLSQEEETWLSVVQTAVERRVAVRAKYFTASRGDLSDRHLSIQRVFVDQQKLVAQCHRTASLRWFCVDRIVNVALDAEVPYIERDAQQVEQFAAESVDGFHSGSPPCYCAFRVREPDARWVKEKLPLACEVVPGDSELIFTATTSGLMPLARFLAGLGAAVTIDTPELANLVIGLAQGALSSSQRPGKKLDTERTSGAPNESAR